MNEKLNSIKQKLRDHAPSISIYALVASGVAVFALATRTSGETRIPALYLTESDFEQMKAIGDGSCMYYEDPTGFIVYSTADKK